MRLKLQSTFATTVRAINVLKQKVSINATMRTASINAIIRMVSINAITHVILQNMSVTTMLRENTNATMRMVSATSQLRNSAMHAKRLLQRKLLLSRLSNFTAIKTEEGDPKVTNMNEQPPLESILTGVLVF